MVTEIDIDISNSVWKCEHCESVKKEDSYPEDGFCLDCRELARWRPAKEEAYRNALESVDIGDKLIVSSRGTGTFKGTVTEFEGDVVIIDEGKDRVGVDPGSLELRGYGYHGDPVGYVERL